MDKYEALNKLPLGSSEYILPKIMKEFQVLNGRFFFTSKVTGSNSDTKFKIEEIGHHILSYALDFGFPKARRDDLYWNFCSLENPKNLKIGCDNAAFLQLLDGNVLDGVKPESLFVLGVVNSLPRESAVIPEPNIDKVIAEA